MYKFVYDFTGSIILVIPDAEYFILKKDFKLDEYCN